jgi:hypothetical protein
MLLYGLRLAWRHGPAPSTSAATRPPSFRRPLPPELCLDYDSGQSRAQLVRIIVLSVARGSVPPGTTPSNLQLRVSSLRGPACRPIGHLQRRLSLSQGSRARDQQQAAPLAVRWGSNARVPGSGADRLCGRRCDPARHPHNHQHTSPGHHGSSPTIDRLPILDPEERQRFRFDGKPDPAEAVSGSFANRIRFTAGSQLHCRNTGSIHNTTGNSTARIDASPDLGPPRLTNFEIQLWARTSPTSAPPLSASTGCPSRASVFTVMRAPNGSSPSYSDPRTFGLTLTHTG